MIGALRKKSRPRSENVRHFRSMVYFYLYPNPWIVEELLRHKKIYKKTAIVSFNRMKETGQAL